MDDKLSQLALTVINKSNSPLETKEVEKSISKTLKDVTRAKLFYRLLNLRGEGSVKGKFVGPGKGVWIWWKIKAFQ